MWWRTHVPTTLPLSQTWLLYCLAMLLTLRRTDAKKLLHTTSLCGDCTELTAYNAPLPNPQNLGWRWILNTIHIKCFQLGSSDNMVDVAVMSVSSSFSHFPAPQFSPVFYFTDHGRIMFLILHLTNTSCPVFYTNLHVFVTKQAQWRLVTVWILNSCT
jgi:hypothetical protein